MLSRIIAFFAVGLALVGLNACGQVGESDASGNAPPKVFVTTLQARTVELTRELPGRTRAFLTAEVRPQVSGIIKRLQFIEGSSVKAGQPLYEIDDAKYRAEFARSQAALVKARATRQAARLAATRARDLLRFNAMSRQDSETLIAAEEEAEAEVGVAEAALSSSKVNLSYAHIVAPIGGRISRSSVTRGAFVAAEQPTVLATIQQIDPIYVELNEPSSDWLAMTQDIDAGRVQANEGPAAVKIVLENGVPYELDGKLEFAEATVDPETGNLQLRAIVSNPKNTLLPGMYVRALVTEGVLRNGILVPQEAIAREPTGRGRALVVSKDGKVESREVDVSRAIDDHWLVAGGLVAGDRVVVEGLQDAIPGNVVQPIERTNKRAIAVR